MTDVAQLIGWAEAAIEAEVPEHLRSNWRAWSPKEIGWGSDTWLGKSKDMVRGFNARAVGTVAARLDTATRASYHKHELIRFAAELVDSAEQKL
jgi:hypothetical protein